MAKKTIISDFSALKGQVTFSEKTPDTKLSAKVSSAPTSKPKDSENGLKVGQCVVLMDSNLRGKIVGLSKTVRIELEDGLIIESAYGEFVVTDKTEIASLKEAKVKAKGQQLQFQMDTFRKVIRENISHRGRKITFIHGIGDGILKAAIRKELDEVLALRCRYSVGDPAVTVVSIK